MIQFWRNKQGLYTQPGGKQLLAGPDSPTFNACSYLHNYPYNPEDEIYSVKFEPFISNFPVFTKDEVKELGDYLVEKLSGGDGMKVLSRVEGGKFRPSKKLLDHIAGIINGSDEYTLLDEQLV